MVERSKENREVIILKEGAKQAIDVCLNIRPEDRLIIVTDVQTMDVAAALMEQAKEHTKEISFFILEDFGDRPLKQLPGEIKEKLENATVSILAAQSLEGELQSVRRPMISIIEDKKIRHAHMVNITPMIMEQGMAADHKEISDFSGHIAEILRQARKIRVTSELGTDFTAEFDKEIPWIKSDGLIKGGKWTNLPAGEVWTVPLKCNGKVIIDGVLGDHFGQKYGLLRTNPVSLQIEDSRVVRVQCSNEDLKEEYEKYIKTDKNANRIGEFALGTNLALKELIGNLLQDEKFPGVHIAVGHPYPKQTGVDWDSSVHCDGVITDPTVAIDGKTLMERGKYQI